MASLVLTERLWGCEDLVQTISEEVHRARMRDVFVDLRTRPGVFEAAMGSCPDHYDFDKYTEWEREDAGEDDDRPIAELRRMGHEVVVRHDDYIYWWTTVIHIDDSRFVMMHEMSDDEDHERFVVEGYVTKDGIKLERMYVEYRYRSPGKAESIDELRILNPGGNCIYNLIPFQFVMEYYGYRNPDRVEIDLSYDSGKRWTDPERVWRWFAQTRWHRIESRRRNNIDL